eukprot:7098316-Heterocapsa_arctica.AAC.1
MEGGLCHMACGQLVPPGAEPCKLPVSSGSDGPIICLAKFFPKDRVGVCRQGSFLDELCRIPPSP